MKQATLIVVEGPDRCGKETQSKLLVEELRNRGFKAVRFEVPFKDKLTHSFIYSMLKNGSAKIFPNTFQFVQFLNKKLFERNQLKEALEHNEYVVLDRWALSSIVYGSASNTNEYVVNFLYENLIKPDYTIVLTGKSHSDRADDSYEADDSRQHTVRYMYEKWARSNAVSSSLVKCEGSRLDVHDNIINALEDAGIV